jgi:hypothetical protein
MPFLGDVGRATTTALGNVQESGAWQAGSDYFKAQEQENAIKRALTAEWGRMLQDKRARGELTGDEWATGNIPNIPYEKFVEIVESMPHDAIPNVYSLYSQGTGFNTKIEQDALATARPAVDMTTYEPGGAWDKFVGPVLSGFAGLASTHAANLERMGKDADNASTPVLRYVGQAIYKHFAQVQADNPQWLAEAERKDKSGKTVAGWNLSDPATYGNRDAWPYIIGNAIPSVLQNFGEAIATFAAYRSVGTTGVGARAVQTLPFLSIYNQMAGDEYLKALRDGQDAQTASRLAEINGIVGALLEFTPWESLAGAIRAARGNQVAQQVVRQGKEALSTSLAKAIGEVGLGALTEGAEEVMQQALQNILTRTYKENQDLFEGFLGSFMGGAIGGGIGKAAFKGLEQLSRGQQRQATENVGAWADEYLAGRGEQAALPSGEQELPGMNEQEPGGPPELRRRAYPSAVGGGAPMHAEPRPGEESEAQLALAARKPPTPHQLAIRPENASSLTVGTWEGEPFWSNAQFLERTEVPKLVGSSANMPRRELAESQFERMIRPWIEDASPTPAQVMGQVVPQTYAGKPNDGAASVLLRSGAREQVDTAIAADYYAYFKKRYPTATFHTAEKNPKEKAVLVKVGERIVGVVMAVYVPDDMKQMLRERAGIPEPGGRRETLAESDAAPAARELQRQTEARNAASARRNAEGIARNQPAQQSYKQELRATIAKIDAEIAAGGPAKDDSAYAALVTRDKPKRGETWRDVALRQANRPDVPVEGEADTEARILLPSEGQRRAQAALDRAGQALGGKPVTTTEGAAPSDKGAEARKYVSTTRNADKRTYAGAYMRYLLGGGRMASPEKPKGLGEVGAQAVRLRLNELLPNALDNVEAAEALRSRNEKRTGAEQVDTGEARTWARNRAATGGADAATPAQGVAAVARHLVVDRQAAEIARQIHDALPADGSAVGMDTIRGDLGIVGNHFARALQSAIDVGLVARSGAIPTSGRGPAIRRVTAEPTAAEKASDERKEEADDIKAKEEADDIKAKEEADDRTVATFWERFDAEKASDERKVEYDDIKAKEYDKIKAKEEADDRTVATFWERFDIATIGDIAKDTGMNPRAVHASLIRLRDAGKIDQQSGGVFRRKGVIQASTPEQDAVDEAKTDFLEKYTDQSLRQAAEMG